MSSETQYQVEEPGKEARSPPQPGKEAGSLSKTEYPDEPVYKYCKRMGDTELTIIIRQARDELFERDLELSMKIGQLEFQRGVIEDDLERLKKKRKATEEQIIALDSAKDSLFSF